MIVRRAIARDADAIADVQVRTWLDAYSAYVDPEKMRAKAAGRQEVWRERLADGLLMWVAVRDDAVVGVASAAEGELKMLYVAPEAQGAGLGRALLDRCVDQLRDEGGGEAVLWVFEQNTSARGFYERMGWQIEPGAADFDLWAPEVRYRRAL